MTEAERYAGTTPFQDIYKAFYTLVTDDMYLEWTEVETAADLENILIAAIPKFQFPRFKLYDYDKDLATFNFLLTQEEIEIFGHLMVIEWVVRQIATCDLTKQKYSSKNFELTSQANHLAKLIEMKKNFQLDNKATQRLYKRRLLDDDGYIRPNYSALGGKQNAN